MKLSHSEFKAKLLHELTHLSSGIVGWCDNKVGEEKNNLKTWSKECDSWAEEQWIAFILSAQVVFSECVFLSETIHPVMDPVDLIWTTARIEPQQNINDYQDPHSRGERHNRWWAYYNNKFHRLSLN